MSQYSSNIRVCKNGSGCLHPSGPDLPLSEFYHYSDGTPQNICKECAKAYQRQRGAYCRKDDRSSWRKAEKTVVDHLRALGIYAVAGIASEWTWVDVVAWGCVRIEVKTAHQNAAGVFQFNISPRRRKNWHKNDLLLLVCLWDTGPTYHLFPKDFYGLYHSDGTPKQSLSYDPDSNWHTSNRTHLTERDMEEHRDLWHLIEDCRREWIFKNESGEM